MITIYSHNEKPIAQLLDGHLHLLDCDMLFLNGAETLTSDGPNELNISTIRQLHQSFSQQYITGSPINHIEVMSDEERAAQHKHMF